MATTQKTIYVCTYLTVRKDSAMLQPVQRQIKSAEKQTALIKQLQSHPKKLQKTGFTSSEKDNKHGKGETVLILVCEHSEY